MESATELVETARLTLSGVGPSPGAGRCVTGRRGEVTVDSVTIGRRRYGTDARSNYHSRGMGVAVSAWQLARAVSLTGQLGVVSGTALDLVLARRLQIGDPGGHMRRALAIGMALPTPKGRAS